MEDHQFKVLLRFLLINSNGGTRGQLVLKINTLFGARRAVFHSQRHIFHKCAPGVCTFAIPHKVQELMVNASGAQF